jgi:hypothetical protein
MRDNRSMSRFEAVLALIGEPGRHEALLEPFGRTDPDRLAVAPGAAAEMRLIELVTGRPVDHRDDRLAVFAQGDRNRVVIEAVRVIHRAVERVDDPDPPLPPIGAAFLLAEKQIAGERVDENVANHRLGHGIHLGHQLERGLAGDRMRFLPWRRSSVPAWRAARSA